MPWVTRDTVEPRRGACSRHSNVSVLAHEQCALTNAERISQMSLFKRLFSKTEGITGKSQGVRTPKS